VFLTLLKAHASKPELKAINETEQQQRKQSARKRKRGGAKQPAASEETSISTSRIRDEAEDEDEDQMDEEERGGRSFEVIETRASGGDGRGDEEGLIPLPDRITVEILRQTNVAAPQATDDSPFVVW
jgi:hypothetical protein